MALQTRPLHPLFGVEIVGIDVCSVDDAVFAEIAEAFDDHSLLLFRGQAITDAEQNLVRTIGNRPALEELIGTLESLYPRTRERAQRNLLVGIAMDEYRDRFERGDYLIRNIVGADRDRGAIALNEIVRVDHYLPGCPPRAEAFWELLTALIQGREPEFTFAMRRFD